MYPATSETAPAVLNGSPVGVAEPTNQEMFGVVFGRPNGQQRWLSPAEFAEVVIGMLFPWRQPTRARGGKPRAPEVMPAYEGMRSRHVALVDELTVHRGMMVESRAEADVVRLLVFLGVLGRVVPQGARVALPDGGMRTIDLVGVGPKGSKRLVSVTEPGESDKRADLDAMDRWLRDLGVDHRVIETPSTTVRGNLDLFWMHRAWIPQFEQWRDDVLKLASEGTTMRFLQDEAEVPFEEDRGYLMLTALFLLARRDLVLVDGLDVEFGPDRVLVINEAGGARCTR